MNEPTSPAVRNPSAMDDQTGMPGQSGVENSAKPGNPTAQPKTGFWSVPADQPTSN